MKQRKVTSLSSSMCIVRRVETRRVSDAQISRRRTMHDAIQCSLIATK